MRYLKKDDLDTLDLDLYLDLVKDLTHLDKDDLTGELAKHSTVYSYYHGLLIFLKARVDRTAKALESTTSILKVDAAQEHKKAGAKATATYLEDLVGSRDEVNGLKDKLISEEERYGYLKSICQALEHKKDMLIQLSANSRTETKLYN